MEPIINPGFFPSVSTDKLGLGLSYLSLFWSWVLPPLGHICQGLLKNSWVKSQQMNSILIFHKEQMD